VQSREDMLDIGGFSCDFSWMIKIRSSTLKTKRYDATLSKQGHTPRSLSFSLARKLMVIAPVMTAQAYEIMSSLRPTTLKFGDYSRKRRTCMCDTLQAALLVIRDAEARTTLR